MKSGIYKIINMINGRIYIGSAININERIANHKYRLTKGTHANSFLQSSFNKHSLNNFKFETVEYCNIKNLLPREQFYLDTIMPEYNICKTAGSKLGYITSEETKLKISNSNKGKIISQESRNKISRKLKGRVNGPCSKETKFKISLANKGNCHNSKEDMMLRTIMSLKVTEKKIDIINDSKDILRTYNSLAEAERELNIGYRSISMCITGKRKTIHKLKFQYHKQ